MIGTAVAAVCWALFAFLIVIFMFSDNDNDDNDGPSGGAFA